MVSPRPAPGEAVATRSAVRERDLLCARRAGSSAVWAARARRQPQHVARDLRTARTTATAMSTRARPEPITTRSAGPWGANWRRTRVREYSRPLRAQLIVDGCAGALSVERVLWVMYIVNDGVEGCWGVARDGRRGYWVKREPI